MNKKTFEKDFNRRFGNGKVHTCFVPFLLPIIGAEQYKYGKNTVFCALNCGVWICTQLRSDSKIVIEHTSDNIKTTLSKHSEHETVYRFLNKLIHRFPLTSGLNILFHCDIPNTNYIDIISPYLISSALIINEMCGTNEDIPSLICDFDNNYSKAYINSIIHIRQNHLLCINDDLYENTPIDTSGYKIICAYPSHSKQKHNKKSDLYTAASRTQNAFDAFNYLKKYGIDKFFDTFGNKCNIDGCIGKFQSSTDIYFTLENSLDHAIETIDRQSEQKLSFIISDFGGGAKIY